MEIFDALRRLEERGELEAGGEIGEIIAALLDGGLLVRASGRPYEASPASLVLYGLDRDKNRVKEAAGAG